MSTTKLMPHQQVAGEAIREAWTDNRSGVYIHGPTGSGKTFLADYVAKNLAHGTYEKNRQDWPNRVILNALNATLEAHASMVKGTKARTAWEMAEECKGAQVVLLDDVGRERGEYGRDLLFSLIDQTKGFLIITSNRDKKALAELYGGDEGLMSRLSALVTVNFPADAKNLRRVN